MPGESNETQLTRVQAAIAAIEGGAQSYSINGRSLTRGDLKSLYDRESKILRRIARAANGGGLTVRRIRAV